MKRNTKIFCAALALVIVFGAVVGGTLAYLMDVTTPVINTFTAGNVNIELTESVGLDLKMVPGNEIAKDPKVTVEAGSEDAWVFIKIEKSDNFDSFMTYEVITETADGWNPLTGVDGVYYREVSASASDQVFNVLTAGEDEEYPNGHVDVINTVEKSAIDSLTEGTYPTLTFTAYACQKANVADAATAWNLVKDLTA